MYSVCGEGCAPRCAGIAAAMGYTGRLGGVQEARWQLQVVKGWRSLKAPQPRAIPKRETPVEARELGAKAVSSSSHANEHDMVHGINRYVEGNR
jgi:hypothetical protein